MLAIPRSRQIALLQHQYARVATVPPGAFLLDIVPGASHGLSVSRRLSSSYSGNVMKIREDGGNTTAFIGFDGNDNLDESAILAHCGANSGFVEILYDQSGNSNDYQQTDFAMQPRICASGVIEKVGNQPAVLFDGVDDRMEAVNVGPSVNEPYSQFFVERKVTASDLGMTFSSATESVYKYSLWHWSDSMFYFNGRTAGVNYVREAGPTTGLLQRINELYYHASNSSDVYSNNVLAPGGGVINDNQSIMTGLELLGARLFVSPAYSKTRLQEAVVWPEDKRADRSTIVSNTNGYYSIF